MNIIYLSPNITLLYHIQYISVFRYSPNMDFALYFKYTLYSIYPHTVNIFHLSSNFDLLPYSNFYISHHEFNIQFWCFLHIYISSFLIFRYIFNSFIFNLSPMHEYNLFISQYQIIIKDCHQWREKGVFGMTARPRGAT